MHISNDLHCRKCFLSSTNLPWQFPVRKTCRVKVTGRQKKSKTYQAPPAVCLGRVWRLKRQLQTRLKDCQASFNVVS